MAAGGDPAVFDNYVRAAKVANINQVPTALGPVGPDPLSTLPEELDAAAFQQEQVATHLTTTFLVLWNGILVGAIAISVFQCLLRITNSAALW